MLDVTPGDFAAATIARAGDPTMLDGFKLYLGVDLAETRDDAEMSRALNAVGSVVESYLGRVIVRRSVTEYYAHHWGSVILYHSPVGALTSVTLDGATVTSDYSLYRDRAGTSHLTRIGQRQDVPMDWRPYANVEVAYTAGWAAIPEDLAYALFMTAADYYSADGTGAPAGGAVAGTGEIKQVTLYDVGSLSYDVGSASTGSSAAAEGIIPAKAVEMLAPYRRMYA